MTRQRKYIVKSLGVLDETSQVIKFAYKLPSYCNTLSGVMLFSPTMIKAEATALNAELSLWINNRQSEIGNHLFTLGYHTIDEQECRMVDVNHELKKSMEITGYVKYLYGDLPFDIHLILECKF